jgi:phosphoglycerate dehydrogenase-like enzyme
MTTLLCGVSQAFERLQREFPELDVVDLATYEGAIPPDAILFSGFDEKSVKAAESGVAWVQLAGTGIDRTNPSLLKAPIVTCAKGAGAIPIAEYVLAAMLASSRRFPDFWIKEPPERWNIQETQCLSGQKLGLIGFGGIGQRVARLALAFDMDVVAVRRTARPSEVPGVNIASGVEEILGEVDHLVLCLPSTPSSVNLLNEKTLALVKPGLHLVNIARGALIDQDALRVALDDGRIARASLDVCVPEPLPEGHWLYSHKRVFLTPHASWTGVPFLSGAMEVFRENLRRYLRGDPLIGVVDVELGY